MQSKIPLLVAFLVVALFTIAIPTTGSHIYTIATDDAEKLRHMNTLSITKHLQSQESLDMSFDGTGLKVGGIFFHTRPEKLQNLTREKFDAPESKLAACTAEWFLQWKKPSQPRVIQLWICDYLVGHIEHDAGVNRVMVYYHNAICAKGKKCSIVAGVSNLSAKPSSRSVKKLVAKCHACMGDIANDCQVSGGYQICDVNDTGEDQWDYFLYPDYRSDDPCKDVNADTTCLQIPCGFGWCNGDAPGS